MTGGARRPGAILGPGGARHAASTDDPAGRSLAAAGRRARRTTAGAGPRTRSSRWRACCAGARLGNPHGELDVEAADGVWVAEIGQPWRNERAGLTDDLLVPGLAMTLEGHRSRNPDERLMKAERVIIAGRLHDLYPDRS